MQKTMKQIIKKLQYCKQMQLGLVYFCLINTKYLLHYLTRIFAFSLWKQNVTCTYTDTLANIVANYQLCKNNYFDSLLDYISISRISTKYELFLDHVLSLICVTELLF